MQILDILQTYISSFFSTILHNIDSSYKQVLKMNTQLKENDIFFHSILEEAGDLIFELNNQGEIEYINRAVTELLGFGQTEVNKKNFGQFIAPIDQITHEKFITEQLKIGKTNTNYHQVRILTKSNQTIWIGQTTKMIFNEEGQFKRAFCVARNITKYKEAKLFLEQAKKLAEAQNLAKNNFISAISHELKTPLNAIMALGHHVEENITKPNHKEDLKSIIFAANHLNTIINDFLNFNEIINGKLQLQSAKFDLNHVLNQVFRVHQRQLKKPLDLSLSIDTTIPNELIGDANRLIQILNNLLQNAIKFTPNGKVHLKVKLVELTGSIAKIYFEVVDTGIGIEPIHFKKIFKLFTQVDNSLSRKYGGTGLGLAIAQKVANFMGSKIQVTSKIGMGSTFSFPLSFSIPDNTINDKVVNPEALANVKILVVEDNKMNQLVIKKFLKKWKVIVEVAENGKIALEKVKSKQYDLILMDLEMPIMNGMDATKAIRELPHGKDMPIIAVTASKSSDAKSIIKEGQFNDLVQKPFIPKVLFDKMVYSYRNKTMNVISEN